MTRQETFNTVKEHLLRQNAKSQCPNPEWREGDLMCAYRGEGGRRCAAGCLIPDTLYRRGMEGKTSFTLRKLFEELGHNVELVDRLQQCHDSVPVEDWAAKLRDIAEVEGLDYGS